MQTTTQQFKPTAVFTPFGLLPQIDGTMYATVGPDQFTILCWPLPSSSLPSTQIIHFVVIEVELPDYPHAYALLVLDGEGESNTQYVLEVQAEFLPVLYFQYLGVEIQDAMQTAQTLLARFQLQQY